MTHETIAVRREGRVGVLTLNRPKVLNALNRTLMPNVDASVEFSAEVECVLPAYVENGAWQVSVSFDSVNATRY